MKEFASIFIVLHVIWAVTWMFTVYKRIKTGIWKRIDWEVDIKPFDYYRLFYVIDRIIILLWVAVLLLLAAKFTYSIL